MENHCFSALGALGPLETLRSLARFARRFLHGRHGAAEAHGLLCSASWAPGPHGWVMGPWGFLSPLLYIVSIGFNSVW